MPHLNRSLGSPNQIDAAATFLDQLKFALEHNRNPVQLGAESPLAQPYFLGHALHAQGDATTDAGRGAVLRKELLQAAAVLWEGPLPEAPSILLQIALQAKEQRGLCDQYYYLLLDLAYFHHYFAPPRNQSEIYDDILHISRATYDRHLREAVRRLGEILLLRLQPTLRLEQPPTRIEMVGRDPFYQQSLAALQAGKSVYLCGVSGIGKTTLGAALAEDWPTPTVFWFTVRLTLNDQLTSLLFALGHFLHQQGASRLWLQLMANGGVMKDPNLALTLTRADLADLEALPLLCFDEIDLLRPLDIETEMVQHTQFLSFLEGLQGYAPLLLMGQRNILPSDVVHTLSRLTVTEIAEWLSHVGMPFTPAVLARLDAYTVGNPRLLALFLVLCRMNHPQTAATLDNVLDQLPQTPALAPIWQRLQRHLEKAERALLQSLAVFRTSAPRDAWVDHVPIADTLTTEPTIYALLQRLIEYRLVVEDDSGGVALLPTLREVIYNQLGMEKREELHRQAGQIRTTRGDYTAAAYHYQRAGQPEMAIAIWHSHGEQEIRRGQAAAALTILQQISGHRLPETETQTLRLLRGQLYQLCGQSIQALEELEPIKAQADSVTIEAAMVGGDALRTLGETDAALAKYGDGLRAAARLLGQSNWLHAKRGTIYLQRRELDSARREVLTARYRLENLEGAIQETTGQYEAARQHYLTALAAAELVDDKAGVALVQRNLGVLAAHQTEAEGAIHHLTQALTFYEQIGDRVRAEEVRSNLAGVYVQFEQFDAAAPLAQSALAFFSARQNSYWMAQNLSNLATIYLELGDLLQAQLYAERTLDQEEPQSYPYALFTLGQVRRAQDRGEEATAYFAQVQRIAQQNEDSFLLTQLTEMTGRGGDRVTG